jgi:tetratricopeptide (TPR) repeat protein
LLRRTGRFHESAAELYRALVLDPTHETILREAARTQGYVRAYSVADSLYDKAVQLDPLNGVLYCQAVSNEFAWKGVTDELRQRLESRPPGRFGLPACTPSPVDLVERNYHQLLAELEHVDDNLPPSQRAMVLVHKALTNRHAGNREVEQAAWVELESLVRDQMGETADRSSLIMLRFARAGQGDAESVLEINEQLEQTEKDDALLKLVSTPAKAQTLTMVGLKQEAIELLRADLESDVGVLTKHYLAWPTWDSLRAEPDFQALLD